MIDQLLGYARDHNGSLLLELGPVVFNLEGSDRDRELLVNATQPVTVHCLLEVAPERLQLMGFADPRSRLLYRVARDQRGVGPGLALAVAGAGDPVDVLRAAAGNDIAFFTQLPGVGRARAEALIKALRKQSGLTLPAALPVPLRAWIEARTALCSEGLSETEAERLLRAAADSGAGTALQLLRAARQQALPGGGARGA